MYHKYGTEYTKEECIQNIGKLWVYYGRPPRLDDLNVPPSSVPRTAYIQLWNAKWADALSAFIIWAESFQKMILRPDGYDTETALKLNIIARDGFRCAICRRSPTFQNRLDLRVTHIIPLSEGGKTVMENLRALCVHCDPARIAEIIAPRGGFSNVLSDEVLLDELRRVAELVCKPVPTQADFDRYARACCQTVINRFGSWRLALEKAGLGQMCSGD